MNDFSQQQQELHPYARLTPDTVLDAIEALGLQASGRFLALNSYENRVYQIELEDGRYIVAKFYRPERWSDAAIREEHAFSLELAAQEIPVIAPQADSEGETLFSHEGFRYALFPRRGGRWPELEDPEVQYRLGQFLGRLHGVGAVRPFAHRPTLDSQSFGHEPARFILQGDFLPPEYRAQYEDLVTAVLEQVDALSAALGAPRHLRLHGDFHPGNILWTERGAHIVDLDDCRMGPAVQDLWMLLSGERPQMLRQLDEILAGYEEFADFDRRELHLIEALRALRLIHYSGWLARRWDDPAFPQAFPWFNTARYWEEQILTLREQAERLAGAQEAWWLPG